MENDTEIKIEEPVVQEEIVVKKGRKPKKQKNIEQEITPQVEKVIEESKKELFNLSDSKTLVKNVFINKPKKQNKILRFKINTPIISKYKSHRRSTSNKISTTFVIDGNGRV